MEQFISFANKRETKFQSRFVIGSSIVLALLCSSLNAIEAFHHGLYFKFKR